MDNELLIKLISNNNRLIIPNFGAFLRKDESKNIVFSPFLKRDDGVLNKAIASEFNIDADQANDMIEQYVAHINSTLEAKNTYYLSGIGVLMANENGAVTLAMDIVAPGTIPEPARSFAPDPMKISNITPTTNQPTPVAPSRIEETTESQPIPIHRPTVAPQPIQRPVQPNIAPPTPQPRVPVSSGPTPQRQMPGGQPMPIRPRPIAPQTAPIQRPISNSQPSSAAGSNQRPQMQNRQVRGRKKKQKSTDIWLIVAILAAVIVIALIVYAYLNSDPVIEIDPSVFESVAPSQL